MVPQTSGQWAQLASDCLVPVMLVLLVQEPLLPPEGQRLRRSIAFFLRAGAALGVAIFLAESGKAHQVWPGHPGFPSGHMTVVVTAAVCLVRRRGRVWLALVGPLAALMGWGLVHAGWHTVSDVFGALALGTAAGTLFFTGDAPSPLQDRQLHADRDDRGDSDTGAQSQ
jgi:membrane-associated phospholipid phosphatase